MSREAVSGSEAIVRPLGVYAFTCIVCGKMGLLGGYEEFLFFFWQFQPSAKQVRNGSGMR